MPVYEFYCPDCHTVYSFLSRRVSPRKRPDCPRCDRRRLERQVSRFAVSRKLGPEAETDDPLAGLDPERLERALASLAAEAQELDQDDPRQAARLMQRLSREAGLELGPGLEEMVRRLEAGEDPDVVEAELGEALEAEEPFAAGGLKRAARRLVPPRRDETLYEM
jgi:putative FmdB family regulatory protein